MNAVLMNVAASCELAESEGYYETYPGSPVSRGILQPDMWGVTPSDRHNWAGLRARIAKFGIRNSLLLAPMPTASTAQVWVLCFVYFCVFCVCLHSSLSFGGCRMQILGNNEAFEPFTSNLYTRRVLSGDFIVINKYMLADLMALGLWNKDMRNLIIAHRGSIQAIPSIPEHLKDLYKTVWEIKMKVWTLETILATFLVVQ